MCYCYCYFVICWPVLLFKCARVGLGPCILSSGKEESEGRSRPHCVIVSLSLLFCYCARVGTLCTIMRVGGRSEGRGRPHPQSSSSWHQARFNPIFFLSFLSPKGGFKVLFYPLMTTFLKHYPQKVPHSQSASRWHQARFNPIFCIGCHNFVLCYFAFKIKTNTFLRLPSTIYGACLLIFRIIFLFKVVFGSKTKRANNSQSNLISPDDLENFSVMFCWSTVGSFCLGRGRQKSLDYAS